MDSDLMGEALRTAFKCELIEGERSLLRDQILCDIHEWMGEAHGAWVEIPAAAEKLRSLDAELTEAGFETDGRR